LETRGKSSFLPPGAKATWLVEDKPTKGAVRDYEYAFTAFSVLKRYKPTGVDIFLRF
jgi:hypothetical protein